MTHSDTHRRTHEIFNNRDWDRVGDDIAPGFMSEDLAQGTTIKTLGELTAYLKAWVTAFSDGQISDAKYFEGPDFSVSTFHARGTNDGQFGPYPATGRRVDVPFCQVLHYGSDGKVLSDETYYDTLTMLRQMGLAPDPTAEVEGLEPVVRRMIAAFDALDLDAAKAMMAEQAQGIDEISRRWLRGQDAVTDYFRELQGQVSDVRTELRDIDETIYGDTGIATCWLDQDYSMGGERMHVSAPTTFVLHREHGEWRVALVHSIPLPEQATA